MFSHTSNSIFTIRMLSFRIFPFYSTCSSVCMSFNHTVKLLLTGSPTSAARTRWLRRSTCHRTETGPSPVSRAGRTCSGFSSMTSTRPQRGQTTPSLCYWPDTMWSLACSWYKLFLQQQILFFKYTGISKLLWIQCWCATTIFFFFQIEIQIKEKELSDEWSIQMHFKGNNSNF